LRKMILRFYARISPGQHRGMDKGILTIPRLRWIAAGVGLNSSVGCPFSIMLTMFLATTPACWAPGLAALCDPVSAISPREKILGNFSLLSCRVGFTKIQPLAGLTSDTPDVSASWATKPLLGVCPVAMMTRSVVKESPLVSSIWTLSPFSGIPPDGIFTLLPVINLRKKHQ